MPTTQSTTTAPPPGFGLHTTLADFLRYHTDSVAVGKVPSIAAGHYSIRTDTLDQLLVFLYGLLAVDAEVGTEAAPVDWQGIALELCAHIRNGAQMPAAEYGARGASLLAQVRALNPARFDAVVTAPARVTKLAAKQAKPKASRKRAALR